MNLSIREVALKSGVIKAKIVRVLAEAVIMHAGWGSDNKGWVVELEDGKIVGLTTNHGRVCEWTQKEAANDLKRTQLSADEINACLQLLPKKKK